MKRPFTLLFGILLFSQMAFSQVYLDEFDNNDPAFTGGAASFASSEANGEWTIDATNTGMWDVFSYELHDVAAGASVDADATGNNKIYVRAKASNVGTQLRMDIQDAAGFATTQSGLTKTLTTDFMILEFDYTGQYFDGGFGGTACDPGTGPCPVDGATTSQLVFYVDPGVGGFNGSIVIDYISFGEEPDGVIMSDVFQDHFDMDSSINAFVFVGPGYSLNMDNSELVITGDGTNPMWDPLTYIFRNPNTLDTIDIDATGNNKLYVKVKSTVANTALRIDLQDIDGYLTTQGSITKIVGTDYTVLEYDYSGAYFDLGFGGSPCTDLTAPCPVNGERIADIIMFIEPGVGEFLGEVTIDYISFGVPLEPAGPEAELVYEDHFNNETLEFIGDTPGLVSTETGTNLSITGDGTGAQYGTVSYLLHDKDLETQIFVDMGPAQGKVFLKAKTDVANVPIRLDLIDTAGYTTSSASLTKIISNDWVTYEFNFTGNYFDGGFGGTPCMTGPCPVDPTAITQMLLYPDPAVGMFNGVIDIDYVSIGKPLDDDDPNGPTGIVNYSDQMDDNTSFFVADASGLASGFADDEWTVTGDGTVGAWTPIVYSMHNDLGEPVMANAVGSEDKLFIRAKSSVDGTELRVDLQDNEGYVTNANAQATTLTTDYVIYELNYANAYEDGGFGGSPCTSDTAPCPVDGERVTNLQMFFNAAAGGFDGTVTIDWVSFGMPLGSDPGPTGVINYVDEVDDNTGMFVEDMPGLVSTTDGDIWTITGDGTGGMWSPVVYSIHNDMGENILADAVGSNDKLFVRAKASADVELRVDVQDNQDYVSNASAQSNMVGSADFAVYEYTYTGAYQDGGFGGSPCTSDTAPCPVDGERIAQLQFFLAPGVGAFSGTLEIDWLAFGEPLDVAIQDVTRLATLEAYPNPVADVLYLEYDLLGAADMNVVVYNTLGEIVSVQELGQRNVGTHSETVNVQSLATGLYVVQLVADGASAGTMRLMKK